MKIKKVHGRQILDSRGQPTVECVLELEGGVQVCASVPSGASVGKYEAHELRDGDPAHFGGKGVLKALKNLETEIAALLLNQEPDVISMDAAMITCDGTPDKSRLGANALLAASIAVVRAQALSQRVELYELIYKLWGFEAPQMPVCMFNIINGGLHAHNDLAIQEFMIMPRGGTFAGRLEVADAVYAELKKLLEGSSYSTAIGDEGGFAPQFKGRGMKKEQAALDLLMNACSRTGGDIVFCLDVAASQFYDARSKKYRLHDVQMDAQQLIDWYAQLCSHYPIDSLEDGLDQDDWDGWQHLTHLLELRMQVVGDDLFATNVERIAQGIERHSANAVLIKPNQIGTVSEAVQAIKLCKKAGLKTIISHRSGETNDSFIADLAVGTAADQLKAGAPVRGERVAKYNRLLAIEELLG